MTIERLPFNDPNFHYHPMEAAIHVTRYQLAQPFVKDKRVLDIACGEGYGSWLLKSWGASYVAGVDISAVAIEHAEKFFADENIEFVCENAETLIFEDKFDLIVSLETIEHVKDPLRFLRRLQDVLSENGTIILSCPNDAGAAWSADEKNPYHLKRYTMQEFIAETESVLGQAKAWMIGSNVFGYSNFAYDKDNDIINWHKSSLLCTDVVQQQNASITFCYNDLSNLPNSENSIYYFGIWGNSPENIEISGTIFPIKPLNLDINSLRQIHNNNKQQIVDLLNLNMQLNEKLDKSTFKNNELERELFYAQQRALAGQAVVNERNIIYAHSTEYLNELSTEEKDNLLKELQRRAILVEHYQIQNKLLKQEQEAVLNSEARKIKSLEEQVESLTASLDAKSLLLSEFKLKFDELNIEKNDLIKQVNSLKFLFRQFLFRCFRKIFLGKSFVIKNF